MYQLGKTLNVVVVHLINPRADKERAIHIGEEVESLIHTLGGKIVNRLVQKLDKPDNRTYIGKGKVTELEQILKEKHTDVVIFNAMAKPGQVHELKKVLQKINPEINVWDRVDLILHIFEKHATTTEAKLQIELARMRYMGPRIYGMGYILSRQGGGIGTSGIGETNTELMKRHWRNAIKKITDQLDKVNDNREKQFERRKRAGFKTVSIVGYTNSGKSSLFNILSGKKMVAEDVLFATLDSSVGKLYLPQIKQEVLITDTIGFIRNLPPRLIQAFKSTLMESLHADVLLHIIDLSDPEFETKTSVVQSILQDLGRNTNNVIYVFNKIDAVKNLNKENLMEKYSAQSPLFISAKTGEGLDTLTAAIAHCL